MKCIRVMLISHSKKFIFIHNYKVAGTSIRNTLNKYNDCSFNRFTYLQNFFSIFGAHPNIYSNNFSSHITASELKNKIPSSIFQDYFKFGFVRDPWDWQVSLYTYALKHETHHQHTLIKKMKTFDDYIEWRINEDIHLQKDFFYDDKNNCLVDFIGKIEHLNHDFFKICRQIDVNEKLLHSNKSRENNTYLQFYTERSIEMVNKAFKEDILLFGYEKPSLWAHNTLSFSSAFLA
jgi:hypothetical protein